MEVVDVVPLTTTDRKSTEVVAVVVILPSTYTMNSTKKNISISAAAVAPTVAALPCCRLATRFKPY